MNILIIVPSFKILGGVANHYHGLSPYWKEKVSYCFYGKRKKIPAYLTFFPDLAIFIYKLIFNNYDIIIINPSLRRYQLYRDGIYHKIAKCFRKQVVTFIHGWDYNEAVRIKKEPSRFCKIYGKSEYIYVLYSEFKKTLEALPIDVPILLTTTKVKDNLLTNFHIEKRNGNIETILFLARANKRKGLDITIKAFEILKKKNPKLKLNICGIGDALEEAISYVSKKGIKDISFKGLITGDNNITYEYNNADIYILPTYEEGMATSILEAMAFGLPIISRPVGGINDFFTEKMGYLLTSFDPYDYAETIQNLIDNPILTKEISIYNHTYAKEHFLASKVTKKIEKDLKQYCNGI